MYPLNKRPHNLDNQPKETKPTDIIGTVFDHIKGNWVDIKALSKKLKLNSNHQE